MAGIRAEGMEESGHIILYGSLMSAFNTQETLGLSKSLNLLGTCAVPGRLYDLGDYPGLLAARNEQDIVHAELYQFRDSWVLEKLDRFEDYWPDNIKDSLYLRRYITVLESEIQAWVYFYNKAVSEADFIVSNNWVEHLSRKQQNSK